jgi:hypothetical protein
MSYALLWIEVLIVLLLWVASVDAVLAHVRYRLIAAFALIVAWLVPLSVLAGLTWMTGVLKFSLNISENWFGYTLSLLVGYVIGIVVILGIGRHREAPGLARASAEWPRGRLALAFLVAFMLASMTLWNMDLEVRGEGAAVRTEAGALLLAVVPPQLPDEQNAATLYEKAFARLKADPDGKDPQYPLEADSVDPKSPEVEKFLARHEVTLKFLREAAALPVCRFDHDYAHPSITMLLPEMNWCRMAALLLQLDARHQMAKQNVRQALVDINAMFRLAQGVGQEPLIIGALVSCGIDHLAVYTLQEALPAVTNDKDLSILHVVDAGSESRVIGRALQGEEAFGLSVFSDLAAGKLTTAALTGENARGGTPMDALARGPSALAVRVFFMPQDFVAYRQLMTLYQDAASKPYAQGRAMLSQAPPPNGLLTRIIAPALNPFLTQDNLAVAHHAEAQTAIALTRYRLAHGAFPLKLDALVPEYLDDVPVDPFDGKPLRFVVKPDKCLIYSVGLDGKDDGGSPYDEKAQTGDIVFSLPLH